MRTGKRYAKILGVGALALALGGCGQSFGDRTLSGAGVGAAAGTVGAAVVGGSLATGAVVGAAAGAVTGAVTDSSDINLGTPWWRRVW